MGVLLWYENKMKYESPEIPPQTPETKTFEESFKDKKELELYGQKIEFVDLVPQKQKSETPVFVAPGWAETPETLKEAIKTFFEAERRTISVKHGRHVPRISDEDISPILSETEKVIVSGYNLQEQNFDIPVPELLKAKSILAVLDECKVEKTDIVAHSEGAINSIIAALLSPERFRNIILVGSAGITDIGEDNALHRTIGFARTTLQDIGRFFKNPDSREALLRANNESTKYIAGNPAAAVDEVGAIASFNIEEMIEKLHEKGIKISLVHGTNETMFPMDEMQTKKLVENEAIYEFYPMKGHDHHSIYMPEEAAFIETILESMEKKQVIE